MKHASLFPALALSATLFGFNACSKSAKPDATKVEKAEPVAVAVPAKKPDPTIAPGTWIGTLADGTVVASLTIDPANRMTIVQQDSPISGSYSIDFSQVPNVLTFTADGAPGQSYVSQIQWINGQTINMTSLVNAPAAPAPAPVPPAAQPTAEPFTGNVANPHPVSAQPATASNSAPEIITITFSLQTPQAAAPAATPAQAQ